jgi:UDP-N-acetylglucosamine--dolichyl-phosphate N-acetylglucosaminephosphotransferase
MPFFIEKLKEKGMLVRDYYKPGFRMIPTGGGMGILLIAMLAISLNSLFFKFSCTNYVALFVIALFGWFGILDDIIDVGRPFKLLIMYYCSYPLIQYATYSSVIFANHTYLTLPVLGPVELETVYFQVIVPTYVLVSANLVNMHSGYNGMASGLSAIVLMSLIIKSILIGDFGNVLSVISITGATLGFYLYERYPSRIFWGNIGSLTVGSAIGTLIVIQGFIVSGFIMLIPHTVNFLMYVYWRVMKYPVIKFGKIRTDGSLEVPNPLTLKWVLPYYLIINEKQATRAMFIITGVFCIIGMSVPW